MTTDKNRFVVEKLKLCDSCDSCDGIVCELYPDCCYVFDDDAGTIQLLRLMMERNDYADFLVQYGALSKHGRHLDCVLVELITTLGEFLDAVAEWLKEKEKKDE